MVSQHLSESLCCFHPRQHPKGVTEDIAVSLVGKGIHTLLVGLCKKIEEIFNVGLMHELAVIVSAEELAEVESYIFIGILIHQSAEVVCVDIKARETCVGVMIAGVVNIPLRFGTLLHNVIPRVDFFLLEVVKKIKGSPGESKDFSFLFGKFLHHSLTKFGLRTLVSFINYDEIPRC